MQGKPKVVSITQRPPVEQPFPTQKEWVFLETYAPGAGAQAVALQEKAPQEVMPQGKKEEGFFFKIRKFFGLK